jgi:hypothetical protein
MGLFYRRESVDSPGVQALTGLFAIPPTNFDTTYGRHQFVWKSNYQMTPNWSIAGGAQLAGERGTRQALQTLSLLGMPDLNSDSVINRFTPAVFFETNAGQPTALN